MRIRHFIVTVLTTLGFLFPVFVFSASVNHSVQIDPTTGQFSGYAWIENHGWMRFDCSDPTSCVQTTWTPGNSGTIVSSTTTKFSWLCKNESGNTDCHDHTLVNWKLNNSSATPVVVTDTNLSGWIFSEEIGWINLSPSTSGVRNDGLGNLSGYAWSIAGSWMNMSPTFGSGSGGSSGGSGGSITSPTASSTAGTYYASQSVTLSSSGATVIRYTVGPTGTVSNPSCTSGSVYTTPITVATSETIKAIGCATGLSTPIVSFDYIITTPPVIPVPVASPAPSAGPFATSTAVTLSSASSTSIIHYTVGVTGSTIDATCSDASYLSSIVVATSETIKAIACNGGFQSTVVSFDYVIILPIIVSSPIASPDPSEGPFATSTLVTLSSTNATNIYYTNDGSVPSCSGPIGTLYSSAHPIDVESTETIKAVGCNGTIFSSVAVFNYVFGTSGILLDGGGNSTLNPPQASLSAGTYIGSQSTTLFSADSKSIHYTIDATVPTCSSGVIYSSAVAISQSETLEAIACGINGKFSAVSTFVYIIHPPTIVSTVVDNTTQAINAVSSSVTSSVQKTTIVARKFFSSPKNASRVQAVATTGVIAGTAVTTVSGLFFSSFSFADILLIPLRLWSLLMGALGLTKRKKPWGTVYDSVTKQPLDPAYVVLKSIEGVDVATAITDLDGRYGFVVPEPGNYSLFVHKTNYMFPSQKLVGQDHDELYRDLYFGEHFAITQAGEFIAKNVPMDPEKFDWNQFAKKSQHLMNFYSVREKWLSRLSSFVFIAGFGVSVVSLIFSTTKGNICIVALYIVLFFIRTFGLRSRPFGGVASATTGKPIPFAIIRISQAHTGVEVMHRVTDSIGRYYCLLPNGEYTVRVDQKLVDGTYKDITGSIPVSVSKGYLSEQFDVKDIPMEFSSSIEVGVKTV